MKVLCVVQRYGEEVVGGSEGHCRSIVRRLGRAHEVEVATTTALDHWTWAEHYKAGDDVVDGVPVRRFAVASGRDPEFKAFESKVLFQPHTVEDELDWPRRQGPHSPDLLEFLHQKGQSYDAVLFWTYIYEPTVYGLPIVPERSALISTAHDELPLGLAPYAALFALPRAFGFLTPEEGELVRRRFANGHIPGVQLGIGLDPAPDADRTALRTRIGRTGPVVLYLGQVSEGKACDELLRAWGERAALSDATLVLVGPVSMELPTRDDVIALGRVTDAEKWGALAGADVLVLPSYLESLGIVLLEAWQQGTPVVVPAWNAVTAGQVARSGGGATYAHLDDLAHTLERVIGDRERLGASGREWVARECDWAALDARLASLVSMAAHGI